MTDLMLETSQVNLSNMTLYDGNLPSSAYSLRPRPWRSGRLTPIDEQILTCERTLELITNLHEQYVPNDVDYREDPSNIYGTYQHFLARLLLIAEEEILCKESLYLVITDIDSLI